MKTELRLTTQFCFSAFSWYTQSVFSFREYLFDKSIVESEACSRWVSRC